MDGWKDGWINPEGQSKTKAVTEALKPEELGKVENERFS